MISYITKDKAPAPRFYDILDAKVALFKLTPGVDSEILSYMLERNDAIIIESYGVGGIPSAPEYFWIFRGHQPLDQKRQDGGHIDTSPE